VLSAPSGPVQVVLGRMGRAAQRSVHPPDRADAQAGQQHHPDGRPCAHGLHNRFTQAWPSSGDVILSRVWAAYGPRGFDLVRVLAGQSIAIVSMVFDRIFEKAPPAGFEPAHTAPEAVALSPELWGLAQDSPSQVSGGD
jgi:hypothetical protein